jgi:putative endonuclease
VATAFLERRWQVVQGSPTPPFAKSGAIPTSMYYVYLLKSKKDLGFYIGYSSDLKRRFIEHVEGKVESTKNRRPLELIYYESYNIKELAEEREKKLKDFGSSYNALLKRLKLRD